MPSKLEKDIERKIKKTISKYKLISKNEKILVALSGGKDSTLVAYFLKKLGYKIEGFHVDLGIGDYSKKCLKAVENLCSLYSIPLHVYNIRKNMGGSMCYIRTSIQNSGKLKNCAICGVIKKWIFNKEARRLKASKIATGHNLDDEAQTFLMNVFKGSMQLSANIGPITRNVSNKKFITRIKPLFFISENSIRQFAKEKNLPVVFDKCPCANDSYRIQVRKFVEDLPEKTKLNILSNFEKAYSKISSKKDTRIKFCENCGEPCRNNICKKCELMKEVYL